MNSILRSHSSGLALAYVLAGCGAGEGDASLDGSSRGERGAPTFADVAPLVHRRCAICHRPGGTGPFPLLTFADVSKRGRQIAAVTASGYMPPWLPASPSDPMVGAFEGDRSLREDELDLLRTWIASDMPQGSRDEAPPVPEWPDGWQLGEPDLVLTMPRAFTVPAEGRDIYRNFVIPAVPGGRRYVRAVEWRPDNPQVVHHAALFIDRSGVSRTKESADPLPGFAGMNAAPAQMPDGQFYGWTPGNAPRPGSEEISWVLNESTDVVLQLHLRPTGRPEEVRVRIGLHFAAGPPTRHPTSIQLRSRMIDIPPGESAFTVEDDYVLPTDVTVLGIYPHAHYLGKDMRAWFTLPGESERRELFHIPAWDFNWQDDYFYEEPPALPRGTKLSMRFVYDNSAGNPLNPSSPPRRVVHGEQSIDEMAELMLLVLPEKEEDLPLLSRDYYRKVLRESEAYYGLLARRQPDVAGWHRQLAETTLRAGEFAESIEHHRRWIELRPQDSLAFTGLARAMLGAGRPADAAAMLRDFLKDKRRSAAARVLLGRALLESGRPDEARSELARVLARSPDDADANLYMGDVERQNGNADLAAERYRAALRGSNDETRALNRLGSVLSGDEAVECFRAAVELYRTRFLRADHELRSEQDLAFRSLAAELEAQGELDEALRYLEWAARIEPEDRALEEEAVRLRERIRAR